MDYFVSLAGNDNNPGTLEKPFATIQHAVGFLKAGDTLYLRGGSYHEAVRVNHIEGDKDQPVIIQPYKGERVILDGTIPIASSWRRYKDQIFMTSMDQDIWQLFVNGESMISARWPNASWRDGSIWEMESSWGYQYDESTYGNFINHPAFQKLGATGVDFTDAVVILNIGKWVTFATKVKNHAPGSESFTYERNLWDRLENEAYWKSMAAKTGWYFFEGKLDMLDTVGEWVYEPDTKILYLWPFENNFPDNLDIRGKNITYAISIHDCRYIVVRGLDFFACTFEVVNSDNVTIEDGASLYPSYSKRMLGITAAPEVTVVDGTGNTIRNCTFAYSDGEGLVIRGESNLVENCYLHDINYSCIGSAVTVDAEQSIGTVFRHNTMHTGGASVGLRAGPGNLIEYNNIYEIGYLQSDGSLIQMSGPAQVGTVIRYNWLHDSGKANRFAEPKYGIRFDGSYSGYLVGERELPHDGTVHHNVIWNTRGVYVKGDSHVVYNNLSFDNLRSDLAIRSGTGLGVRKNAMEGFNYEGWGPGIAHPDENDQTITRNNLAGQISSSLGKQSLGLPGKNSNNWAGDIRLQVRDPGQLDFRLQPGSPLIDAGYYIEGITKDYKGKTPDIGPYESGSKNYWIPGRRSAAASSPIPKDGAWEVREDSSLIWLEGYEASAHEVYFGKNWKAVSSADSNSREYMGVVKSNVFELDELELGTTYFWRVDVLTKDEKLKGNVWSFTVSTHRIAKEVD